MQLCDGNTCLTFQMQLAASIWDSPRELWKDPNMFMGVGILPDCIKLFAYHGLGIGDWARTFNLWFAFTARSEGKIRAWFWGHQRLAKKILDKRYAPWGVCWAHGTTAARRAIFWAGEVCVSQLILLFWDGDGPIGSWSAPSAVVTDESWIPWAALGFNKLKSWLGFLRRCEWWVILGKICINQPWVF